MKRTDIERIREAGLISTSQMDAIITHFHLAGNRSRSWLAICLGSLAGALILAGIIMLISANWDTIPPMVKMGTGIALMVLFWVIYLAQDARHPVVADVFSLLGGGMWLANIALYGQIFQLQNPEVEGCALFLAGIVLLPLLTRQRVLVAAVAVGSFVLLSGMAYTRHADSFLGFREFLGDGKDFFLETAFPALAVCWWMMAERCRGMACFMRDHAWLAVPAALAFCSMAMVITQRSYYTTMSVTPENMHTWMAVLAAVACVPLAMLVFKPAAPRGPWFMLTLATTVMVAVPAVFSMPEYQELPTRIIGCGLCFLYGLSLMHIGSRALRIAWINYGVIFIIGAAIGLVSDVFDSLTDSGLALIGCGLFMLLLLILLERTRRKVVSRVRQERRTAYIPKPIHASPARQAAPAPAPAKAEAPAGKAAAEKKEEPAPVVSPLPPTRPATPKPATSSIPAVPMPPGVPTPPPAPAKKDSAAEPETPAPASK